LTAFASLLDEIAWTRVLVMIVGGSTYAFTLILLVFLLGIGIGSAIVARGSSSPADTALNAGLAQALTAVGAAVLFLVFTALPVYIISVFQVQYLSAATRLLLMGGLVGLVVLVPAIGMGMTFPLLTDLAAGRDRARGADVGLAYGLNTIGSIAGTVLTGFVFVVLLGTATTLRLGLLVNAVAAITLAMLAVRGLLYGSPEHRRLRPRALAAVVLASLGLGAAVGAPSWSSRLIDLGPTIYARAPMNRAQLNAFLEHRGARQMSFVEGRNTTVSVWESGLSRHLKVNGKTDASDHGDMDTQIMLGLAPAVARPDARSALVVGFGSGVTAGVLARVPGMERVRVVELEPAVLTMSHFFRHANGDVLARPNVGAIVDDARSALQLTRDRFDVIVSEPSNPWLAGVATLYTPEFFRIARSRLTDDGVFCQWIQLYQLPLPVLAGIVRNLQQVFPHVEIWFGKMVDVMVLGSARPLRYDPAWLARLLGPGAPLAEDGREWLGLRVPSDYFGRFVLGDSGVKLLTRRATLAHTDDRPQLEFVAARRFIDSRETGRLLDSLLAMGTVAARDDRADVFMRARVFGYTERALPYVDSAGRARPQEVEWQVRGALIHLGRGDTARAEATLAAVLRRAPREPDALLYSALIAAERHDARRARDLLGAALAAGADTARVWATRALLAVRDSNWVEAGAAAWRTFAAGRNNRSAYIAARENLGEALNALALDGPPALADSLLEQALTVPPAWAGLFEARAIAALRAGRCDAAIEAFQVLLDFGITRPDAPHRVAICLAGNK
ncbi:MAG: fused MFS/spermidine synthase, partial [Gemmatimonadales bacterium]